MRGVDDWYLNYAHRHELTPRFSSDDDVPDPFVLGEAPQREWAAPSRRTVPRPRKQTRTADEIRTLPPADRNGTWQSAAKKWLTRFPQGTNRECLRALRTAGHTGASTQLIARLREGLPKSTAKRAHRKARTTDRARSTPVIRQPRRPHHDGNRRSTRLPWHTFALRWLREHPGASNRQWREAIEEAGFVGITAAALSALRTQTKPTRTAPRHTTAPRTAHRPEPTTRPRYCDACGLAVGDDGHCRC